MVVLSRYSIISIFKAAKARDRLHPCLKPGALARFSVIAYHAIKPNRIQHDRGIGLKLSKIFCKNRD